MVIQEYQDPRVGKYLKYGYWYQAHRGQLRNIERNILIAVIGVIWLVFAYFTYNFVLSQSQYNQVLKDLTNQNVNVLAVQQARAPSTVQIGAASVLAGENQTRADFMAVGENANSDWSVTINYKFVWADGQTTSESAIILPEAKAVLATRGVTVNSLPASAELQVISTHWRRLRTPAEKERVKAAKTAIIIDSPVAEQANSTTSATYIVKNQSIYDWLTPRFVVVLSQGGVPVAVGLNEIPKLLSSTEQTLEYRWLQTLPGGLSAEVYPVLDPFDESSFSLPHGGDYAL